MRKELADWFEQASKKSFAYGEHDCGLAVADAVKAQTGIDVATEFRGKRSMLDAHRAVRKAGGFAAICTTRLGYPINTKRARKGDVHLLLIGRHEYLSVDMGNCVAVANTKGMALVNKEKLTILSTWRTV
jgi:hypothetical protein